MKASSRLCSATVHTVKLLRVNLYSLLAVVNCLPQTSLWRDSGVITSQGYFLTDSTHAATTFWKQFNVTSQARAPLCQLVTVLPNIQFTQADALKWLQLIGVHVADRSTMLSLCYVNILQFSATAGRGRGFPEHKGLPETLELAQGRQTKLAFLSLNAWG